MSTDRCISSIPGNGLYQTVTLRRLTGSSTTARQSLSGRARRRATGWTPRPRSRPLSPPTRSRPAATTAGTRNSPNCRRCCAESAPSPASRPASDASAQISPPPCAGLTRASTPYLAGAKTWTRGSSPREGRIGWCRSENFSDGTSLGLWVPAFAGTTVPITPRNISPAGGGRRWRRSTARGRAGLPRRA